MRSKRRKTCNRGLKQSYTKAMLSLAFITTHFSTNLTRSRIFQCPFLANLLSLNFYRCEWQFILSDKLG